jgi:hypothetical protein
MEEGPGQAEREYLVPIIPRVGILHVAELALDDDGADDEHDGERELEDYQTFPQMNVLEFQYACAFKHAQRIE